MVEELGPSLHGLKRTPLCRHSRTVETAQRIGFSLSVPYTDECIPNYDLHPPANERPSFGLK